MLKLVIQPGSIAQRSAEFPTLGPTPISVTRSQFNFAVPDLNDTQYTITVGPIGFDASGASVSYFPVTLSTSPSKTMDDGWNTWAGNPVPRTATLNILTPSFTTFATLTFSLAPTATSTRFPTESGRALLDGAISNLAMSAPG